MQIWIHDKALLLLRNPSFSSLSQHHRFMRSTYTGTVHVQYFWACAYFFHWTLSSFTRTSALDSNICTGKAENRWPDHIRAYTYVPYRVCGTCMYTYERGIKSDYDQTAEGKVVYLGKHATHCVLPHSIFYKSYEPIVSTYECNTNGHLPVHLFNPK